MMKQDGMTLLEILAATLIATVMVAAFLLAFMAGDRSWQSGQSRMAVTYELRRGLETLNRELASSRADQLDVPADGEWYEALSFRVPEDLDGDATVLDGIGAVEWSADLITYDLGGAAGNQLQRTQGAATRVMANGIETLQFRRQVGTPDQVEILTSAQRGVKYQSTGALTTRVRLRN